MNRSRVFIGAVAVCLAILLTYANTLSNPFIFDDQQSILRNPTIRDLRNLRAVLSPPGRGAAVQNRPVVNLTLAINFALHGERVAGYHLFNLAVHIVSALTLMGVVHRTLLLPRFPQPLNRRAATYASITALLWAVHPLNTEAVTYIIQRSESLFSMFYLLMLYCCIRGYEGNRRWFAAAVVCCLIGMGCKEAMVTAPVMAFLYDRAYIAQSWKEIARRRWGLYAALAATWSVLAALLASAAGARGEAAGFGFGITPWEYARTQCWALARYLYLVFWPTGLVMDYGMWTARTFREVAPHAALVAILAAAALWLWVRRPHAAYPALWFFAILSPSSSFVPLVTQTVAEKRMYLPLAGVITLLVVGLGETLRRRFERFAPTGVLPKSLPAAGWAAVACIALALGTLTVLRNRDYRSEGGIWEDTIRKRPDNARAYFNRGRLRGEAGDWNGMMADYAKALELKPDFVEAYNNRGNAYSFAGNHARALEDFSKAIRYYPRSAGSYNNRGVTYLDLGDYERALADFSKAIEISPDRPEFYCNRANARNALGRYAEALADCEKAIALAPDLPEPYYYRANAYSGLGDDERALADYDRALRTRPDWAAAYDRRAAVHLRQGRAAQAIADSTRAIELQPTLASAYATRALAYGQTRQFDKARADAQVLLNAGVALPPELQQILQTASPMPR